FRLFLLGRLDEALSVQPSQELGGALIQVRLGARQLDLGVARPARRQVQVERDARAPRADHHRVRQGAQGLGVARLAVVARDEMLALELLPGAELAGPEQRDEVVQLAQVVLERRRREQQDEVPLDFLDELVGRAAIVLPGRTSSARVARPPRSRSTRWATSIWWGSSLIALASSVISRSKPGTRAMRSASRRSSYQARSAGGSLSLSTKSFRDRSSTAQESSRSGAGSGSVTRCLWSGGGQYRKSVDSRHGLRPAPPAAPCH